MTDDASDDSPYSIVEESTPLQKKLQEAISECDRLSKALSQEQVEHEQTRQTLMTALGDTVEQLERERQRYASSQGHPPVQGSLQKRAIKGTSAKSGAKTPLPEQQQKQLAPAPPSYPDADPV